MELLLYRCGSYSIPFYEIFWNSSEVSRKGFFAVSCLFCWLIFFIFKAITTGFIILRMISLGRFICVFCSLLISACQVILFLFLLIILSGVILSLVENLKFFEALYLSFITALTIGYGDLTPHSPLGKLISIILGIIGIIFSGIIVAAAIKALEKVSSD